MTLVVTLSKWRRVVNLDFDGANAITSKTPTLGPDQRLPGPVHERAGLASVNVALPTLSVYFDASMAHVQWIP